ncbi:MAG: hypothetical protein IJS20_06045 [Bacteroidales bacterium]|nr:hypothetical protein [Bacteroidales bacterium]
MKTLLLTFVLSLFCACAFPQKITGKWTCSKEVVERMHIGFDDVRCTYSFKKNGTLIIKIKGNTYVNHGEFTAARDHHRSGSIEIKGKYKVHDGRITTQINKEDIKAYAMDYSNQRDLSQESSSVENVESKAENVYGDFKAKEIRAQIIHKPDFWDWDNEPITITKEELVIGDKLKCKR